MCFGSRPKNKAQAGHPDVSFTIMYHALSGQSLRLRNRHIAYRAIVLPVLESIFAPTQVLSVI